MSEQRTFIGKFQGVVSDNQDPEMRGRIRAKVQDVFGEHESGWALPAVPYAGKGVGLFLIPPNGASVWIEFEQGNPEYPIWTGCFWGKGEAPVLPALPDVKMLKTDVGTITLDDTPGAGGLTIETTSGFKILLDMQGITIENGQNATITLSGPQVSVNNGALEVT
ncbi:MAG: baseplate assembly protein [Chloroflexi bacterium]|nr:MAG: baseplate assembly protein [Chloroflexota bacterium]